MKRTKFFTLFCLAVVLILNGCGSERESAVSNVISLPRGEWLTVKGNSIVLSPDGKKLVFASGTWNSSRLNLRLMERNYSTGMVQK